MSRRKNVFYRGRKALAYSGRRRESQGYLYRSTEAQVEGYPQKKRCTAGPYPQLQQHSPSSIYDGSLRYQDAGQVGGGVESAGWKNTDVQSDIAGAGTRLLGCVLGQQ